MTSTNEGVGGSYLIDAKQNRQLVERTQDKMDAATIESDSAVVAQPPAPVSDSSTSTDDKGLK